MSFFEDVIKGRVAHVRNNHALEHATLSILAERDPSLRLAGYSDAGGFWILGNVETGRIEQAVGEALTRLRGSEPHLAIHPHCGTNLVTTGFLAGGFAWLGMLGAGRSTRDRVERLPVIISLVTLAVAASQPLGPLMQRKFTTQTPPANMRVHGIERRMRGDVPLHRVATRF